MNTLKARASKNLAEAGTSKIINSSIASLNHPGVLYMNQKNIMYNIE